MRSAWKKLRSRCGFDPSFVTPSWSDRMAISASDADASWLVNGGGNGYRERQLYFAYAINEVLDAPRLTGTHTWNYPALGQTLTGTFPPGNPPNASSVQVNYERQIP